MLNKTEVRRLHRKACSEYKKAETELDKAFHKGKIVAYLRLLHLECIQKEVEHVK